MIRINLLPVREARRQADLRQQGVLLGVAIVCGLALCGVIHVSKKAQVRRESAHIAEAQVELQKLDAIRARVETFRKERDDIEQKLVVIAKLERSRSGPVRIMDEIATRIPKRLWLTKLVMRGGELRLEGVSLDAEIVAAFLTGLEESELIHQVELEETRLEEKDGLKLTSFKVRTAYQFAPAGTSSAGGGKQTAS